MKIFIKTKIFNKTILIIAIILSFLLGTMVYPLSIMAISTPDAPEDLEAEAEGSDTIELIWDEVEDAEAYCIYRSESSSGEYQPIDATDDEEYTDEDLDEDETYYYKVTAINRYGEESDFSNRAQATTGDSDYESDDEDNELEAPDDLEAEADGSDTIELTWDKVYGADEYYIYRSESSTGDYDYIGSTDGEEYTDDDDLDAGETYYYKVRAVDSSGDKSDYSNRNYAKTDYRDDDSDYDDTDSGSDSSAETIKTSRLAGQNRYETAAKIAQSGWSTSNYAVIASGEDYADALCSVPLAYKYSAPILLTPKNILESQTRSQLTRLKVQNVFIIGGTGVISVGVENALVNMGIQVTRIAGSDRYETSMMVASKIRQSTSQNNTAVIANGRNFYDALSIASVAAIKGYPILLSPANSLPSDLKAYIQRNFSHTVVVGDTSSISSAVYKQLPSPTRISDTDRYKTNLKIIETYAGSLDFDNCYLATGGTYADALSGLALAALKKAPVFLVDTGIDSSTADFIKNKTINQIVVFGGTGAISDTVLDSFGTAASGNGNVPDVPANVKATSLSSSRIKVTWTKVSNAASYIIYRSTSSSGTYTQITKVSSTTYTDIRLNSDKTYYYRVKATNIHGTSNYSSTAYATTEDDEEDDLEAPENLEAEAKGSEIIELTWDEVDDAEAYCIYRSESSSGEYKPIEAIDDEEYIDKELDEDETYYYKVTAINRAGDESGYSNKAHATTGDDNSDYELEAPEDLEAEADGSDTIELTWDKVYGADEYYIYRSESSTGDYDYIGSTDDEEYTDDDDLDAGETYYYKVKALDSSGDESDYSSKAHATTDDDEENELEAPDDLEAEADGCDTIELTWDKVFGADEYYIYRSESSTGDYDYIGSTDDEEYTDDDDLDAGETYYYKVRAVDSSGDKSDYSFRARATTDED